MKLASPAGQTVASFITYKTLLAFIWKRAWALHCKWSASCPLPLYKTLVCPCGILSLINSHGSILTLASRHRFPPYFPCCLPCLNSTRDFPTQGTGLGLKPLVRNSFFLMRFQLHFQQCIRQHWCSNSCHSCFSVWYAVNSQYGLKWMNKHRVSVSTILFYLWVSSVGMEVGLALHSGKAQRKSRRTHSKYGLWKLPSWPLKRFAWAWQDNKSVFVNAPDRLAGSQ